MNANDVTRDSNPRRVFTRTNPNRTIDLVTDQTCIGGVSCGHKILLLNSTKQFLSEALKSMAFFCLAVQVGKRASITLSSLSQCQMMTAATRNRQALARSLVLELQCTGNYLALIPALDLNDNSVSVLWKQQGPRGFLPR